jgi:hypothetical protein
MCRRKTCRSCGKATWAGCGAHVEQVLAGVPETQRCACPPGQRSSGGLLSRLFGKRTD